MLVSVNSEDSAFLPAKEVGAGTEARLIVTLPLPGQQKEATIPIAHEERKQIERKQMENAVKSRLQSVQFGEVQTNKSIAIVPLIATADGNIRQDGEPAPCLDCWQCGSYVAR